MFYRQTSLPIDGHSVYSMRSFYANYYSSLEGGIPNCGEQEDIPPS